MNKLSFPILCVLAFFMLTSCQDEADKAPDTSAQLSFSVDTLSFDTIFSTLDSRTRSFVVYNKNDQDLVIDTVKLLGGTDAAFKYNVDGFMPPPTNIITNVRLQAHDSLTVFVEVKPNTTGVDDPIVSFDELYFSSNSHHKNIVLMNYSQDAIILRNEVLTQSTTLTSAKPYLVIGTLYVPENMKLTLEAGTKLYFQSDSRIYVDGQIEANGSFTEPVIFRGFRNDYVSDANHTPYVLMPGQWDGIYLSSKSTTNLFKHIDMYGMTFGIVCTAEISSTPTLVVNISYSKIHTSKAYAVYNLSADVTIENSLIYNCGEVAVYEIGGRLKIIQSTLANYLEWSSLDMPSLDIQNYTLSNGYALECPVYNVEVVNSIIMGKGSTQVYLDQDTTSSAAFNVLFAYCHLKLRASEDFIFQNCSWSSSVNGTVTDHVFKNTELDLAGGKMYDFHLGSDTQVILKANQDIEALYPYDLDGYKRVIENGCPGAYDLQDF